MSKDVSSKRTIEELLLSKNLLTEDQLEKAKNIQAQTLERLEDILMRMGFLAEREVLDLWAEFLSVSVVDLTNIKVDAKILSLIPEYQAKQYKVVPLRKNGPKLVVVIADPFDIMATDMIAFLTQCKLEMCIAPRSQIETAIKQLYSWEGFSVAGEEAFDHDTPDDSGTEVVRRASEEGPVVQFLNAVFKQAILKRASDIHVEPREEILLIRFRIDGILHDAMTGPKSLLAPLISRIKILSYLDISEKRLPQDGRLRVKMEAKEVDFRVSTVPSLLGEKAVMRLLARESAYDLDNIGFLPDDLDRLKSALDEPYGMVLVTGPTGAGKTTTLFGMLKYFSSSEINIFTIENPIEYRIDGITQVQINEKVGLTFAGGLRAALRQDPDIILVGEIRDLETAEIAFRAALTGHKVLSTLHTNNAPASINRLINMGVAPYLVAAAVRVVAAQKLLHRICPACKTEYRPAQKILQRMRLPAAKVAGTKFFKGIGCKECNQTGSYGRVGVYETMVITNAIRDIIMEGGGQETVLKRIARLNGMKTMREIAVQLAYEGRTTLEEVLYITPTDEEMGQMALSSTSMARTSPSDAGRPTSFQSIDPNDPVLKSVLHNLEDDFWFFNDEELAKRFQLSLLQVQECLTLIGGARTVDYFQKKFGKNPGEMSPEEIADIYRLVLERNGRMPSLVFDHPETAANFAKAMADHTLRTLSEKVGNPEHLPAEFTEAFCREQGLDQALEWAKGSRFQLVEAVFPGRYKPWQFGEISAWLAGGALHARAMEALEWVRTVRLGCSRGDLPQGLTIEVLKEGGLGDLLSKFGGSVYNLVQSVYPGVFQPWQFPDEEAVIWFREDRFETAKTAVKWLIETVCAIPIEEIPRRLSLRDFHQHGLSKLLDLFNQNVFLVVDNAYPGKFKAWEYAEQGDVWRSGEALETAKEATLWLITKRLQWDPAKAHAQVTRRHFVNNGLGCMLGMLFQHSPFLAVENAVPGLKNNEIFQKAMFQFSQEMRDLNLRWQSLAEKIAINQFGRAKFKVSLPNLKIAPIVPENERIYVNASNQVEYVPQVLVCKMSVYDDFSDISNWVPYCDRLVYWVLCDDRGPGYVPPAHPKVKLIFSESMVSSLRTKGQLDIVDKVHTLKSTFDRLLDRKAPQ